MYEEQASCPIDLRDFEAAFFKPFASYVSDSFGLVQPIYLSKFPGVVFLFAFIFPSAFIYLIYLKSLHLISRELPYPTWGKEIVHRLKSAFLKEDIFCQSVPRKVPPIPNNPCDWYISPHLP